MDQITKEEINRILRKKGDVRGVVFQTDADYILREKQEEGLRKVEGQLKKWGVTLNYKEIKPMSWYPIAWRTLSILAAVELFGWDEEDIRKMGENAPKTSIIVRLFFRFFPDMRKFAEQAPKYWRRHYTSGILETVKVDIKNKEIILYLNDFAFHPIQCKYYEGYFKKTVELTRPKDSVVTAKEIQCSFREGGSREVYQLRWSK